MRKLLIVVLFLSGCASVATIDQEYAKVNYDDGISKVEAKRIAQKFLLSRPEAENYAVSAPGIDTAVFASFPEWKGKAWVVGFSAKSFNVFNRYYQRMFVVGIDKNTGNIRFYYNGYSPGGYLPFEMQGFGDEGRSIR